MVVPPKNVSPMPSLQVTPCGDAGVEEGLRETPDQGSPTTESLQRQKKEANDALIQGLEEDLHRCVTSYGISSSETEAVATNLVIAYNHLAMKMLSQDDIKGSLRLLQNARLLTRHEHPFLGDLRRLRARAVTLNNLGCLMKKWGKPRVGIALLKRALRIEAEVPGATDNPAGTHLNMSAALSAARMHRAAAVHAEHAVDLISEAIERAGSGRDHWGSVDARDVQEAAGGAEAFELPDSASTVNDNRDFISIVGDNGRGDEESSLPSRSWRPIASPCIDSREERKAFSTRVPRVVCGDDTGAQEGRGGRSKQNEGTQETSWIRSGSPSAGLLAVAYFNLAVEREYLGQRSRALDAYERARVVAGRHLGPDSPILKWIEVALESPVASTQRPVSKRGGVESFPSIGKLILTPRSSLNLDFSRVHPRGRLEDNYPVEGKSRQSQIRRAYESPGPYRSPVRPSRGAWTSKHRPRTTSPPRFQHAGRWTRDAQMPADAGARCTGPETANRRGSFGGKEGLLWRARTCSDRGCSPREARRAQLIGGLFV